MNAKNSTDEAAPDGERRRAIKETLNDIRRIVADGSPDREMLARITLRLERLAAQTALFTRSDFPPPSPSEDMDAAKSYRMNKDDGDEGIALYLASINPGKTTIPHNHTTWAVIVAIDGQEENRIYRRTDDGNDPNFAWLVLQAQVVVRPGTSVALLPDDLHSIHVIGTQPTLHFHLYGRPLEMLFDRIGVNLETGAVMNYSLIRLKA